jgi:type VI secretion system protein ImpJ
MTESSRPGNGATDEHGATKSKAPEAAIANCVEQGMHLAQHHFQAQSRFFEDSVQFALTSLFFKPYGLVACELDAEALRNDTVSLVHARGIMPDGLPFDIPASDPSLNALPIRDRFSPTSDSHLVLLGIPEYRPDQANFATNGASAFGEPTTRYTSEATVVRDDMTGRDERPLTIGRRVFVCCSIAIRRAPA